MICCTTAMSGSLIGFISCKNASKSRILYFYKLSRSQRWRVPTKTSWDLSWVCLKFPFLSFPWFLCALASLRSIVSLIKQTQIAVITTESISQNEIGLCQYQKYQCQVSNVKCQMSNVVSYQCEISWNVKCQIPNVKCKT